MSPFCFFFFNDTATTEIYTLPLHDALPISAHPEGHCRRAGDERPPGIAPAARHGEVARRRRDPVRQSDRKSTRLNSSHLVISYAVFCLKKKKDRICQRPRSTPQSILSRSCY